MSGFSVLNRERDADGERDSDHLDEAVPDLVEAAKELQAAPDQSEEPDDGPQ